MHYTYSADWGGVAAGRAITGPVAPATTGIANIISSYMLLATMLLTGPFS